MKVQSREVKEHLKSVIYSVKYDAKVNKLPYTMQVACNTSAVS